MQRFNDWKNTTRAKYRKIVQSRLETGGGDGEAIKMSPLEDRGLAVWGKVVVTGSPRVPIVAGMQQCENYLQSSLKPDSVNDKCEDASSYLQKEIEESITLLDEENQSFSESGITAPVKSTSTSELSDEQQKCKEPVKTKEPKSSSRGKFFGRKICNVTKGARSIRMIGEELLSEYKEQTGSSKEEIELKEKIFRLDLAKLKFEVAKYKFENPSFSFDFDLTF